MRHQDEIARGMQSLEESMPRLNPQWRLKYHLTPAANWMNDPNGLVYFKDEYHVFYQHHPFSPNWGPMYWGHATSKDLIHWEHLPIALAPSEWYDYDPERGGCYSGSAVVDNGILTLVYTGKVSGDRPSSVQCVATSTDGLVFQKYPQNPVIQNPPYQGLGGFRDPKVWRHGDFWYMVIGSGKDGKGIILLYRSANLLKWDYLGVALEGDPSNGSMWECPDLFTLGDKDVLLFSPLGLDRLKTMYFVGQMDYNTGKFTPQFSGELDYGGDFYAAQTFLDANGRRVLLAWMDSWRNEHPTKSHGWVGALTLPRTLRLAGDYHLVTEPVTESGCLRREQLQYDDVRVEPGNAFVPAIREDTLEMELTIQVSSMVSKVLKILLRCSDDGREYTCIRLSPGEEWLFVDTTSSGVGEGSVTKCPYPTDEETLKLRLFLDKSSLEVFVNDGRYVLTNRIYPQDTSLGIKLCSEQGTAVIEHVRIWNYQ